MPSCRTALDKTRINGGEPSFAALVKLPPGAVQVYAPGIPSLSSLKKLSLEAILDILVIVSHVIAGDPDIPGDSGILGAGVMNYELPAVGVKIRCVRVYV